MNEGAKIFNGVNRPLSSPVLWVTFILYVFLAGYTIAHHEMWGDEIHSWNIAKGSTGFTDLINNSRYEGHPPAWYIILWSVSKFTHDPAFAQATHVAIACLSVFLILFFSPFSLSIRLLIPFGYFFLYEYAVISRNYAVGVLIAICICLVIRKNFRYKLILYYFLLFLLAGTHLQGILLAASLHLYFLLFAIGQKKKRSTIVMHAVLGILIAMPSLYFIFPPADSQLNTQFWMKRWGTHKLTAFIQAPLRAFLPVPAWWNYHSWNTQFLVEAKESYPVLRFINLLVALIVLLAPALILRKNKKSLALFVANLVLSFILAVTVITLTAERHAGFIYTAFIMAYWLYCYETPTAAGTKWLLNSLLVIQIGAAVFSMAKDIQYTFSNSYKVNELLMKIPPQEKAVTDYWALNAIATFTDKPFFCVDIQKEVSFVLWNRELGDRLRKKFRYAEGIGGYFQNEHVNSVYMLSIASPETLHRTDSQLAELYQVVLIDKRDSAIEKAGNLYLYKVSGH